MVSQSEIDCVSTSPTSPKAKSAPATPCNVTPITFHQHEHNFNTIPNPNLANTLPPDIRKNISATCRVLNSSIGLGASDHHNSATINSQCLDDLAKRGDDLMVSQNYSAAIRCYSQWIELAGKNLTYLKKNFMIYSQRAEAYFNLGHYSEAIEDSMAARELNPKWTQAYLCQGRCQLLIGQQTDSLAVFSYGLAQDPSDKTLFEALVTAALESNLQTQFEPTYNVLKSLKLETKPFFIVSALGQELLTKGHHEHAAIVLESALVIGTDNKRSTGSVLSSLSYAYSAIKNHEKAATYMQKELDIESELEDVGGQCRVLSNLGYTFYKMRKFDKSLEAHRRQVSLAMRAQLYQKVSLGLNAIGHVHMARNDFIGALTSHTRCLEILKELNENDFKQFKELLSIGVIHAMLGDFDAAEGRYKESALLLKSSTKLTKEECTVCSIMLKFNLAYLALKKQSDQWFVEANQYYTGAKELAQDLPEPKRSLYEMRACNGMGQAYRLYRKYDEARDCFRRQLDLAKMLKDRVGQSQALCNLGLIYQHFKDYDQAWKMFEGNLHLAEQDPLLRAYAYSYLGSMSFLHKKYHDAQQHYEVSLNTFKELDSCTAERQTIDLNLTAIQKRIGHSPSGENNTHQKRVVMA